MSHITKRALATRVLRQMGLVASDEEPSSTDLAYVMAAYDDKLAEWRDRNLVYWPNTTDTAEEIPSVVAAALRNLLINEVAMSFGKEPLGPEELLLKPLYRHVARNPTRLPVKADYF